MQKFLGSDVSETEISFKFQKQSAKSTLNTWNTIFKFQNQIQLCSTQPTKQ